MDSLLALQTALGDGAQAAPDRKSVHARIDGTTITARYTTRGAGSYTECWTEVDAEVAHRGLVLSLRITTAAEEGFVAEGLSMDLKTGDPAFDAAYVIEAGPTDVAFALLDTEIRHALLDMPDVAVETVAHGVRIEQRDWVEDVARLRALIALAGRFAQKIPEAWRDAEMATAGYRQGSSAADRKRSEEIATVESLREKRRSTIQARGCVAVIAIFLAIGLFNILVWLAQR